MILTLHFNEGNGITPGTSHFRGVGLNDYQWVANTLGATFGSFSKSHEIPVYGFGGQYQGRDYDLFQCGTQPKVRGVSGLLEAYDYVFSTGIVFGDRCNYDNVIMAAAYESQKQLVSPHLIFQINVNRQQSELSKIIHGCKGSCSTTRQNIVQRTSRFDYRN